MGEFRKPHIAISMTEDYHPTDNAVAERVNGTIKTGRVYVRPQCFKDRQDAERQIAEFIRLLQQPSAAYEHRHADSRNGLSPAGRTTEMPETEKIRRKDEMEAESFLPLQKKTTKIE
ncbi:integrase core domain-containing protein [uncultured Bacteroides sp.]|uniref:integrase core domain-containing protein n=1 Tax=uncultured Bacteroides sp. TaxID=162156 RepID=UPI002610ED28|nr:integrase core domain-containing protein [uncultured Bacteroides sp.]